MARQKNRERQGHIAKPNHADRTSGGVELHPCVRKTTAARQTACRVSPNGASGRDWRRREVAGAQVRDFARARAGRQGPRLRNFAGGFLRKTGYRGR